MPKTVEEEDAEFVAACEAAMSRKPETMAVVLQRITQQPLTVPPMLVSPETWKEWLEELG